MGVDLDDVVEVYRLLGVPVTDVDDPAFEEREVRLVELMALTGVNLPSGMGDEILRSVGAALTIVAESEVAAFVGSFEDELDRQGGQLNRAADHDRHRRAGARARRPDGASAAPPPVGCRLPPARSAMAGSHDRLDTSLTVGFVDLVGFTSASATMAPAELLDFMQEFHARTFDVVTAGATAGS